MTTNIVQLNTANSQSIWDDSFAKESSWQKQSRMTDNAWHINTLQDIPHLSITNPNNQALC